MLSNNECTVDQLASSIPPKEPCEYPSVISSYHIDIRTDVRLAYGFFAWPRSTQRDIGKRFPRSHSTSWLHQADCGAIAQSTFIHAPRRRP